MNEECKSLTWIDRSKNLITCMLMKYWSIIYVLLVCSITIYLNESRFENEWQIFYVYLSKTHSFFVALWGHFVIVIISWRLYKQLIPIRLAIHFLTFYIVQAFGINMSSGKVSIIKLTSSNSNGRSSRKRKRIRTNSAEKLVVKIQSKREKRKALQKAETAETAATVVSETEIKDEPLWFRNTKHWSK